MEQRASVLTPYVFGLDRVLPCEVRGRSGVDDILERARIAGRCIARSSQKMTVFSCPRKQL